MGYIQWIINKYFPELKDQEVRFKIMLDLIFIALLIIIGLKSQPIIIETCNFENAIDWIVFNNTTTITDR